MNIKNLARVCASRRGGGVALTATLACAIAVAGCGGSVGSVVDPVAQAATTSTKTVGYRLNMTLAISSSALPTPITGSGQGAFNVAAHAGAFTLSMNLGNNPQVVQALGGSTLQVQELIKGQTIFMKLPSAITSRIPGFGGKPWVEVNLAKLAGVAGLSSLTSNPATSDPSQLLNFLRASGHVTKVGTEQVGGLQTTHYRGTVDLSRIANAVPAASRQAVQQSIQALEKMTTLRQLPFDVWVDGQHLVRKMTMSFSQSISGQSESVSMRIDIPQYGPQPVPATPPADQVTNLSALTGGGA
jgi:hypothetical protein